MMMPTILFITLTIASISMSQSQRVIFHDLNIGNGFAIIQLDKIQLIANYTRIIHEINLDTYIEIIDQEENELNKIKHKNSFLKNKIQRLRKEIETMIPHKRNKRGLINIAGTGFKYLFGIMDDNDRTDIENRLKKNEKYVHNLINNNNEQKNINNKLDNAIFEITRRQNQITNETYEVIKQLSKLEEKEATDQIKENLNYIDKAISKIREIVLTSHLGVLTRDILDDEELIRNNVTLRGIENIKMVLTTLENKIFIIVKIPTFTEKFYNKLYIQPIPNHNNQQIIIPTNIILNEKQNCYKYKETYEDLEIENNVCLRDIFKTKYACNYERNEKFKVIEIGTNHIVIINAKNLSITNNCDFPDFIVNGHASITLNNCEIHIDNIKLSKTANENEILLPNPIKDITPIFQSNVSVDELHYKHISNVKNIEELKYQAKSLEIQNYLLYGFIILCIIITLWLYLRKKKTQAEVNIKLESLTYTLEDARRILNLPESNL